MRVTRKTVERVRITGRMAEQHKAIRYCHKHGFITIRSGAYPLRRQHRLDLTRFLVTAEREVSP